MPELLVIFDCVVFLQGLIKASGPAVTCLKHFEEGRFQLAVSPEILAELRDVLTRSSLRQSFPLLTEEKADRLIELLLLKGTLFRNVPQRSNFREILATNHTLTLRSRQAPILSLLEIAICWT